MNWIWNVCCVADNTTFHAASLATVFSRFRETDEMCTKEKYICIHSVSYPLILWGGSRSSSPRTTRTLHGKHKDQQMVLLIQNQYGTKKGRRWRHSRWSLDHLWAPFLWELSEAFVSLIFFLRPSAHMAELT